MGRKICLRLLQATAQTANLDQRLASQVKKIEIGREYFIRKVFEQADNAHGGFWLGAAQDSYLVSSNGKTNAFKMDGRPIGAQLQHRVQRQDIYNCPIWIFDPRSACQTDGVSRACF